MYSIVRSIKTLELKALAKTKESAPPKYADKSSGGFTLKPHINSDGDPSMISKGLPKKFNDKMRSFLSESDQSSKSSITVKGSKSDKTADTSVFQRLQAKAMRKKTVKNDMRLRLAIDDTKSRATLLQLSELSDDALALEALLSKATELLVKDEKYYHHHVVAFDILVPTGDIKDNVIQIQRSLAQRVCNESSYESLVNALVYNESSLSISDSVDEALAHLPKAERIGIKNSMPLLINAEKKINSVANLKKEVLVANKKKMKKAAQNAEKQQAIPVVNVTTQCKKDKVPVQKPNLRRDEHSSTKEDKGNWFTNLFSGGSLPPKQKGSDS